MYPPRRGPIPLPTPNMAPRIPCILALSDGEYRSATAAMATGMRIPPPRPWMARQQTKNSMFIERPARTDPPTNRPSPMRKSGFLPYRSDSFPAMGIMMVSHSM